MKLTIYAYKDNALGCYTSPFYDDRPTENIAISAARSIVASPKKETFKHKVLYKIGEYDDATATIINLENVLVLDCDEVLATVTEVTEDGRKEGK